MSSFQIQDYIFSKTATIIVLWLEYTFFKTTGRVNVQFRVEATGEVLGTEFVDIPEEVWMLWTDDDQVILDYVCQKLNITIIKPE